MPRLRFGLRRIADVICVAVLCIAILSGQAPPPSAGVLWRDQGAIASLDLFWGSGGPDRVPQGPFTFLDEDTDGTQPKITVTDARGETWDVKFGPEVHAEVAANRIVWALGYLVEELYFVPHGTVVEAKGLQRAAEHIGSNGRFEKASFRRQNPAIKRGDEEWTFRQNPFLGRQELSGLRILMTMICNWDIRGARNNKVLHVTRPDGSMERWFIVSDLGATFGRMGGRISSHSKWDLDGFKAEGFIEKVVDGVIHLDYDGFDSGMDRVTLEHAVWFAELAAQLTADQVRSAFETAGASAEEVAGYSKKMMEKIAELRRVVDEGTNLNRIRQPKRALARRHCPADDGNSCCNLGRWHNLTCGDCLTADIVPVSLASYTVTRLRPRASRLQPQVRRRDSDPASAPPRRSASPCAGRTTRSDRGRFGRC